MPAFWVVWFKLMLVAVGFVTVTAPVTVCRPVGRFCAWSAAGHANAAATATAVDLTRKD
ncbi:hypothetical protein D3C83_94720 [compost metagenome]